MRGTDRTRLSAAVTLALGALLAAGGWSCSGAEATVPDATPSAVRAARRAYSGAPPVMPHAADVGGCASCHEPGGVAILGMGVAPTSPHVSTDHRFARCTQCHLEAVETVLFANSTFVGLAPRSGRAERAHPTAPPIMDHRGWMRDRCLACHDGSAARPEIRTTHPDRHPCRQCHVERAVTDTFEAP